MNKERYAAAATAYQQLNISYPNHISLCYTAPTDFSNIRPRMTPESFSGMHAQVSTATTLFRYGATLVGEILHFDQSRLPPKSFDYLLQSNQLTHIAANQYYPSPDYLSTLYIIGADYYESICAAHRHLSSLPTRVAADFPLISNRLVKYLQLGGAPTQLILNSHTTVSMLHTLSVNLYAPDTSFPDQSTPYLITNPNSVSFTPEFVLTHFYHQFVQVPEQIKLRAAKQRITTYTPYEKGEYV